MLLFKYLLLFLYLSRFKVTEFKTTPSNLILYVENYTLLPVFFLLVPGACPLPSLPASKLPSPCAPGPPTLLDLPCHS